MRWAVVKTYRPAVRYAWGKKTITRHYTQTFATAQLARAHYNAQLAEERDRPAWQRVINARDGRVKLTIRPAQRIDPTEDGVIGYRETR